MKKYFIISDIHSFYTPMIEALNEQGYQKDNPNHILIVLGDLFDRGDETIEVYNFLSSIHRKRRILIYGNHEQLFLELLNKKFPDKHDFSNKTVKTFCQIANNELIKKGIFEKQYDDNELYYSYFGYYMDISPIDVWKEIRELVKQSDVAKFIKSKFNWVNYYEFGYYIFVHSFIPTKLKAKYLKRFGEGYYSEEPSLYEYDTNWRESDRWKFAVWGCPFTQFKAGLFDPEIEKGKILVCGHWHTSDFFKYFSSDHSYEYKCAPIYYSLHLIGIDGGVMWSRETGYIHKQNVLVIEEIDLEGIKNEKA